MKIAFVSTVLDRPWGGNDAVWIHTAEFALEKGHSLLLAVNAEAAAHPRASALREKGAQVAIRSAPDRSSSILSRARRAYFPPSDQTLDAVRTAAPDLVVFSCGAAYDLAYEPAWCEWLLSSRVPFRIVVNFQEERPWLDPEPHERIAAVFGAAVRIFFISERNREVTCQHLLSRLPNSRVIHPPLRWKPSDVTVWPETPPWRLAAVARLEPVSGIDLLLHSARLALPLDEAWEINVYGTGPQRTYLESAAVRLGLESRVVFHGFVAELREIWSRNHLFVSPALAAGAPLALPEALLCGRPALATRTGMAEEWVQPWREGVLAESSRVLRLTEALREAWDCREKWEEMGRSGSRRILHDYRFNDFQTVLE